MIIAGTLNLRVLQGCTFEALQLQMQDENGDPVDITDYTVASEVRSGCGTPVIYDLDPSITDPTGGVITIPEIDDETTRTLETGKYFWDMLLEDSSDNRQQILKGAFTVLCTYTDQNPT